MKPFIFFIIFVFANTLPATEVDRLLKEYTAIKTVTCQIRRTVGSDNQTMRFVSRVYWQSDDRLHVDNLEPIPRRIISDGSVFYSYADGDPKGFSRPVAELSKEMLISLRKIPGTAMDHLLRMTGDNEEILASTNGVRQVAYSEKNNRIVLRFDEQNRLEGIDFFDINDPSKKTASYRYFDFYNAEGAWVPLRHEATVILPDGKTVSETVQVDRFIANQPVASSLFSPGVFFDKTIDFVNSFARIYDENE